MTLVTLKEIAAARERISQHILKTPHIRLRGTSVWLKAESLQATGAFKLRGAVCKVGGLTERARSRGVVAGSSGNHAQAVAFAAKLFGSKATIVMPSTAPRIKVEATRFFGADVVFSEPSSDALDKRARELEQTYGYTRIPPFDDPAIIAATGTIGLEILEALPEVTAVTVPVSGGGLIAGIATAIKSVRSDVKVIGVEPELANDAHRSLIAGRPVRLSAEETHRTIADGLRVCCLGELTWEHIHKYVDGIVTVSESEILSAMRQIVTHSRLVAEPSGAVSVAAWLTGRLNNKGPAVAIVSGGNLDPSMLCRALSEQV